MLIKKYQKNLYFLSAITLIQLALMQVGQAAIFKCTNAQGAVYYNDKPCPTNDKEKKMKAAKDVVNGHVPLLKKFDAEKKSKRQANKVIPANENSAEKRAASKKDKRSESVKGVNKHTNKASSNTTKTLSGNRKNNSVAESALPNQRSSEGKKELTAIEKEMLFIDMHAGYVEEDPSINRKPDNKK